MRRARRPAPHTLALAAMVAVYAGVFSYLSLRRYDAFWTGRFDLGNMTQAVWSTAHGHPLETTDIAGRQFVRLGAHVDPILVLFTPLAWTGALPQALLVAQAAIVSLGALPAYWLGRRWLGDGRLALAAAGVYLLYPPLQWATLTEFHPVTLAAPLLLFCIWAAEERRPVALSVAAVLAALCKEEVGLALAVLGVWIWFRGSRRTGAAMAVLSLAWVAFAILWVIPHFNGGRGSAFISRYSAFGGSGRTILTTLLTHPWRIVTTIAGYDRLSYLVALLVPLALLPLLAPLLAAAALPELGINLLADWFPQYSIEFQYVAVIVPFFVAAAILGLGRLRTLLAARRRLAPLARPPLLAAVWIGVVAVAGVNLGPLPWWSAVPAVGSDARVNQYRVGAHAAAADRAVARIPSGVPVSADNLLGSHLSERRFIYTFPVVRDAAWVVVDRRRPYIGDRLSPARHAVAVARLLARPDMRVVSEQDGIILLRRLRAGTR